MPPPKYIRVMEVGKKGAWHHHLVMQETDLKLLRECWQQGGIHVDPLYTDGNYRKIAEYFVKYAKGRWRQKKRRRKKALVSVTGIKKPTIGKPKMIKSRELGQIRIPKGYYLDRDSVRRGISGYDGHETFCYTLVMLPDTAGSGRKRETPWKVARRSTGTRRSTCT